MNTLSINDVPSSDIYEEAKGYKLIYVQNYQTRPYTN